MYLTSATAARRLIDVIVGDVGGIGAQGALVTAEIKDDPQQINTSQKRGTVNFTHEVLNVGAPNGLGGLYDEP
jgi:hypothetical protein